MKWSEVIQLCPTLCDTMNSSLPGSAILGIFQARILEWAAISFSRGSSQPRDQTRVSCIEDRRFIVWATMLSCFSPVWLWNPIDGSPSCSAIPGFLQARVLEWVAISFSNALKWKVKVKLLSCVRLLETPWTAAYQAPLSMGFARQEYWSGLPLPSPAMYEFYALVSKQKNLLVLMGAILTSSPYVSNLKLRRQGAFW